MTKPSLNSKENHTFSDNTNLINMLYEIDKKLKKQNDFLYNNLSMYNADNQKPLVQTNHTEPVTQNEKQEIDEIKYSLRDDMYNPEMNFAKFINDPRLKSLSKSDKDEIMNELTRKINNNEINREAFLTGYKP